MLGFFVIRMFCDFSFPYGRHLFPMPLLVPHLVLIFECGIAMAILKVVGTFMIAFLKLAFLTE